MQPVKVGGSRDRGTLVDEGSLDIYLSEIGRYPLLSKTDERAIADQIQDGDEEALNLLIRSNLRFVVSVAKRYQNQGVSLADLINEGNLGLVRAAHKFDASRDVKFISYAVWWIRQSILQALAEQSRIVRVPLNRTGQLYRIARRTASLQQELGRTPTAHEVAEGLDLDVTEVEQTMAITQGHISLDAPVTQGESNKLLDYLPDQNERTTDAAAVENALSRHINKSMQSLGDREALILTLYYGLGGVEPLTLEEIGAMLGVTRERVRQIKKKALSRLRGTNEADALETFLC